MVWQGVIIKESLEEDSLLKLCNIDKTVKKDNLTLLNIEVEDNNKEEFIKKAIFSIKKGKFYLNLIKDGVGYIIFNKKMFKFSKGYPEIETAKEYGKSLGILEEQMPFEYLLNHPFR